MRNRLGFTLIELLVVVLIIGILAAVALPQYQKAVDKSRFAEAKTILRAIRNAQEACRMEQGGSSNECLKMENLVLQFPTENAWENGFQTKDFSYSTIGSGDYAPVAWYKKYDVCICIDDDDNFVGSNEGSHCGNDDKTPYDVLKMLKIKDVGNQCWMC